jgi:hypothetical protein
MVSKRLAVSMPPSIPKQELPEILKMKKPGKIRHPGADDGSGESQSGNYCTYGCKTKQKNKVRAIRRSFSD